MERTDPKSGTSSEPARLLVIAGRDSSGGAGVDADMEAVRWAGASGAGAQGFKRLQWSLQPQFKQRRPRRTRRHVWYYVDEE